jgi:thiol-disulfide isomerase/thioredoxin
MNRLRVLIFPRLLIVSGIFLIVGSGANAQTTDKYFGKLTALRADVDYTYQQVFSTTSATIRNYRFEPKLPPRTVISLGKFIDDRTSKNIDALLLEPPNELPSLVIDLNSDLRITPNERFTFATVPGTDLDLHLTLKLPISNKLFKELPISVRYYRGFRHPQLEPTDRLLDQTVWAYALADVAIDGKQVKFRYPFNPSQPTISTTEGQFGIDVDGDGAIGSKQFSIETSYASNEEIVFRYGDKYLSTASIDLEKNEVIVRRREESEYLREELAVGKTMPDFSFVDFSGKTRHLSEFRGKYLLVEWWGVWCADCVRDMPFTVAAYKKFRSRGFEILGLNWDDRLEDAAGFLQKSDATWPQARKDSIKTLTEVTYRIQSYPAAILLDPEGRVISLDQKALEGPRLAETLESIIPLVER